MSGHEEERVNLLPTETVHEFAVNTFVENIAIRRTGQLLVTVYNKKQLIQVDPHTSNTPQASTVHEFDKDISGIVGCGDEDAFYVSSGVIGEKGTWAIFKVEMANFNPDGSSSATVTKQADVPDALFLNGSTVLNQSKGLILAADSFLGAVFCTDVSDNSGKPASLWLQDKALGKVTDNPMFPGLNGIKLYDHHLYMSNTDARTFMRVRISADDKPDGGVEPVADDIVIDDFAFDIDGSAYLMTHIQNSVVKLQKDGTRSRIAGGPEDTVVAGTTAAAFGRMEHDHDVLYVTTNGGMSYPINGTVGGGRVLRIKVGRDGLQR